MDDRDTPGHDGEDVRSPRPNVPAVCCSITGLREMAVDVEGWLKSLSLEQYAAAFRENAIDAEVLLTLTADDFKEMGVIPIGHRRRLLDAIAKLQNDVTPSQVVRPPGDHPASTDNTVSQGGERRQLTVMF